MKLIFNQYDVSYDLSSRHFKSDTGIIAMKMSELKVSQNNTDTILYYMSLFGPSGVKIDSSGLDSVLMTSFPKMFLSSAITGGFFVVNNKDVFYSPMETYSLQRISMVRNLYKLLYIYI